MPLEPRELNRRIADALGMELGARTDQGIAEAVFSGFGANSPDFDTDWQTQSYEFNGAHYDIRIKGSYFNDYGVSGNLGYGAHVWHTREGKPYQADLEAHVANWRRDPPDWAGDLETAFGLGEEMRKRNLEQWFVLKMKILIGNRELRGVNEFDLCHASAYDRAAACLLALGGSLDE